MWSRGKEGKERLGTSLVAQGEESASQHGTQVQSLVQEDPTGHRAMCHSSRAHTPEPGLCNQRSHHTWKSPHAAPT